MYYKNYDNFKKHSHLVENSLVKIEDFLFTLKKYTAVPQ